MVRININYFILLIAFIAWPINVVSQGCSDAGFCSVNAVTPEVKSSMEDFKNSFKTGLAYGMTKNEVTVLSPYAEYTKKISPKLSVSSRFIFGARTGSLANNYDVADVLVTSAVTLRNKLVLIAGAKFPFNKADRAGNGVALPMEYQTSLGTTDLIWGLGYELNGFRLALAWQQPIVQNKNAFLASDYSESTLNGAYVSTNQYERKGDVLIRISHQKTFGDGKYVFTSSVLPIYHLANDTYIDEVGDRVRIPDSRGLTLNLNVFLRHQLSHSNYLEFFTGAPALARKVRPDGLSQFSVGIEYGIRF